MRGSRVQAVVNELQGEKIDIIPWSPDIATFVVNALAPAEVSKVVIDEDRERIEVVVPDTNNQLSLAIGRRGQNVRLASQLTGWDIDILTEQEESERRQADFENSTGSSSNRSMSTRWSASCSLPKASPRSRNSRWWTSRNSPTSRASTRRPRRSSRTGPRTSRSAGSQARGPAQGTRRRGRGQGRARRDLEDLVKFGENDIKSVDDLAGCATDDLVGWTERKEGGEQTKYPGALEGLGVSRDDAEAMIMQARVKAGWITEADLAKPAEVAEATEDQSA